jgi:phosphoglycolate phosphatase
VGDTDFLGLVRAVTRRSLIVFDLDGTLVDSQRDLAAAANALIAERGGLLLPDAAIARMVGEGAALLVKRALTAAGLTFDDASVPRFLELYDERLLDTTVAYPGIDDAVRQLAARAPIAVLTNKPLGPTRRLLDALGLAPFIAEAIGGDGPFPRKPDPSGLRHLVARFGASADSSVMIGDSRIDFETARAAGSAVVVARYGFGYQDFLDALDSSGAVLPVDRARELPEAVDRLLERR